MKNICALLSLCLLLLPSAAEAAPKKPSPPEAATTLSLPEKGPLPADATVAGLPVTLHGSDVIVSAGNNDHLAHMDLGQDALTPFVAVLNAYPHARTVELSWYAPYFMSADSADVLYDRVKHIVTVDYSWGGGDEAENSGKVQFTHVQESVFAAMLRAHPGGQTRQDVDSSATASVGKTNSATWGGFQYLYQPRYGCRVLAPPARHKRRHHHLGA